jgi:hypothetical protein
VRRSCEEVATALLAALESAPAQPCRRLDEELPNQFRASPNLVVEVDAVPGGFVCSAALKDKVGAGDVRDAVRGERRVRRLFSKEQRKFLQANAPEGAVSGSRRAGRTRPRCPGRG